MENPLSFCQVPEIGNPQQLLIFLHVDREISQVNSSAAPSLAAKEEVTPLLGSSPRTITILGRQTVL